MPFNLAFTVGGTINCYSNLTVLAVVTWQVLVVAIPMVFLAIRLQVMNKFFFELYHNNEKAIKYNYNFFIEFKIFLVESKHASFFSFVLFIEILLCHCKRIDADEWHNKIICSQSCS